MHRRRLLWNEDEYELVSKAKLNGWCCIDTGLVIDSTYQQVDTEFGILVKLRESGSHMVCWNEGATMQVYINGNNLWNQGLSIYTSVNSHYDVYTTTTDTTRTLKVNSGSTQSQSLSRPFSNAIGKTIYLFSLYTGTYPLHEVIDYINIKVNSSYVRKYKFVKNKRTGVISMVDELTQEIYHNIGTGYFSEYNS